MKGPRVLDFRTEPWDSELLGAVVGHAQAGGLLAMPTETVYGFGCVADGQGLESLLALKARTIAKPFLALLPSAASAEDLQWTPVARELANVFWPGALTLILGDPGGSFPSGVRSPEGGVAVRVTPNRLARTVVETLGTPVVSTSANIAGHPPALTAEEAASAAENLGAGEELWVLDGGRLDASDPSTIVDCTGPGPIVVRSGAIPLNRLRCVVPTIHESA